MQRELDQLQRAYPLSRGWRTTEVVADTVQLLGQPMHRAGLVAERRLPARGGARSAGNGSSTSPAVGSAAQLDGSPLERSYFELLERVSLLEVLRAPPLLCRLRRFDGDAAGDFGGAALFPESPDPARFRYARSNGVALHRSWRDACRRAAWELVERDRVLRAWLGAIRPEPLELGDEAVPAALRGGFEWLAYGFDAEPVEVDGEPVSVVGVFAFPRVPEAPLVYGFAARPGRPDATRSALEECLQRLGFLFGEAIPERPPAPAPNPLFHQEHFLYPGHHRWLRAWLDDGHDRYAERPRTRAIAGEPIFADLTPPELRGRLVVAKAVWPDTLPLAFGPGPEHLLRHLPPELRIHPVA
jgi:hypothetical protein